MTPTKSATARNASTETGPNLRVVPPPRAKHEAPKADKKQVGITFVRKSASAHRRRTAALIALHDYVEKLRREAKIKRKAYDECQALISRLSQEPATPSSDPIVRGLQRSAFRMLRVLKYSSDDQLARWCLAPAVSILLWTPLPQDLPGARVGFADAASDFPKVDDRGLAISL